MLQSGWSVVVSGMPRPPRIQVSSSASLFHHCVSRVVDRNFVFGIHERDVFRKVLRQVESFSGVRVVTWTILSNHFHVLLEVVPAPAVELTDDEILERCRALYPRRVMEQIEWEFGDAQRRGGGALERLRRRFLLRMWNLSEFMKTLKQKFTIWFNRHHDRVGTLWESRFKSVLVEGSWQCLLKVAAYVDLNAVRAGLAKDPKDYRWCGYAEAVGGDRRARKGLAAALDDIGESASWREAGPRYRKILYGIGGETSVKVGFSRAEIAKVWVEGGRLSLAQLLRCRVRYFTDGAVLGGEAFVDAFFERQREHFGARRESGARRMRGAEWGAIRALRDLRVQPLSLPT